MHERALGVFDRKITVIGFVLQGKNWVAAMSGVEHANHLSAAEADAALFGKTPPPYRDVLVAAFELDLEAVARDRENLVLDVDAEHLLLAICVAFVSSPPSRLSELFLCGSRLCQEL
jgi:hypothetical protein